MKWFHYHYLRMVESCDVKRKDKCQNERYSLPVYCMKFSLGLLHLCVFIEKELLHLYVLNFNNQIYFNVYRIYLVSLFMAFDEYNVSCE